jgi:hypothetical protein
MMKGECDVGKPKRMTGVGSVRLEGDVVAVDEKRDCSGCGEGAFFVLV